MAQRINIPANTPWASLLAYSRAVAVGGQVFVAGTVPVDAHGQLVGDDDAYLQARQVLKVMVAALGEAGAGVSDVVRMRIYLRDYEDLDAVARAQFEVFEHCRPACTVLRADLARREFRVQMDAEAHITASLK
ncbi:MAG: Rid family hydrolase [Sterolibacterium sp.]|jgi:enamine deaminase RidA (YjgF/YER057c/UK114 family)